MTKKSTILGLCSVSATVCILSAIAVSFASCGTTSYAVIDDAYYWPDQNASVDSSSPAQSENSEVSAPSIELISAQDTTITVRIKR